MRNFYTIEHKLFIGCHFFYTMRILLLTFLLTPVFDKLIIFLCTSPLLGHPVGDPRECFASNFFNFRSVIRQLLSIFANRVPIPCWQNLPFGRSVKRALAHNFRRKQGGGNPLSHKQVVFCASSPNCHG